MSRPKKKYSVIQDGFTDDFYHWEKVDAERKYKFWVDFYADTATKKVMFYDGATPVKTTTFKVEVIEKEITDKKVPLTEDVIKEIFQKKTEETFQELVETFNLQAGDFSVIQAEALDRYSSKIVELLYEYACSNI